VRAHSQAFFSSLFLARLADQVLLFLVPLVVYQTTKKVSWSGFAFTAETLPRYLFFPILGALCDRISPLKLMRVSQLYRAVACVGGVAAYAVFGGIGWLIALSACCGVLTSQGVVAREVLLPQIFKQYKFEKVLSYSQLADQMGMVLGPMLAAILLGWWHWQFVVTAAAILFFAADMAMAVWRRTNQIQLIDPEPASGHWTAPMQIAWTHVLHLPGLKKVIALAAGENLIIGVTLATSAAMVTGLHHETARYYAALQTAGAIATIVILLGIAHISLARKTLGAFSFVAIFLGGLIAGFSPTSWGYAIGFLLIVGFDKMFNVYIRSTRQQIIPAKDYGKTTGVVILLNNMTQPLAGLVVGIFSGPNQTSGVIVALSLCMGILGIAVSAPPNLFTKRRETSEISTVTER
jgi:MFS family permease